MLGLLMELNPLIAGNERLLLKFSEPARPPPL